jgi:hypothetical protein
MKIYALLLLVAALIASSAHAKVIPTMLPIPITGKVGFYEDPKEDGFTITITPNSEITVDQSKDVNYYLNTPGLVPVKRVAILGAYPPALKQRALKGETVTILGWFIVWQRHVKLNRKDIVAFEYAP